MKILIFFITKEKQEALTQYEDHKDADIFIWKFIVFTGWTTTTSADTPLPKLMNGEVRECLNTISRITGWTG